ncbi:MAG: hypothetical protein PHW33_04880 [Candidatus Portnoybacteria bacterium]|nr:hypothetical protein [Candidatus Portnoybacteria bacterium]
MGRVYPEEIRLRDKIRGFLTSGGFIAFFVFLLAAAFYLLTLSSNFADEFEFFDQAMEIEGRSTEPLPLTPNHLLWVPIGKLLWHMARLFGYTGGSFLPLQVFDALLSALVIALYFLILLRLTGNRSLSLILSLCMASTHYWWSISVQMRPYSFGALMLLLSFSLLAFRNSAKATAASSLAFTLAALDHLSSTTFFPAALVLILMKAPSLREKGQRLAIFLGIFSLSLFLLVPLIGQWTILPPRFAPSLGATLQATYYLCRMFTPMMDFVRLFGSYLWGFLLMFAPEPSPFPIFTAAKGLNLSLLILCGLLPILFLFKKKKQLLPEILSLSTWVLFSMAIHYVAAPLCFGAVFGFFPLFALLGILALQVFGPRIRYVFYLYFLILASGLLCGVLFNVRLQAKNHLSEDLWARARYYQEKGILHRNDVVICSQFPLIGFLQYEIGCKGLDPRRIVQDDRQGTSLPLLVESRIKSPERILYLKFDGPHLGTFDDANGRNEDTDSLSLEIIRKYYTLHLLLNGPQEEKVYLLKPIEKAQPGL